MAEPAHPPGLHSALRTATCELFSVGFNATWEFDLFGGVRRAGVEPGARHTEAQAWAERDAAGDPDRGGGQRLFDRCARLQARRIGAGRSGAAGGCLRPDRRPAADRLRHQPRREPAVAAPSPRAAARSRSSRPRRAARSTPLACCSARRLRRSHSHWPPPGALPPPPTHPPDAGLPSDLSAAQRPDVREAERRLAARHGADRRADRQPLSKARTSIGLGQLRQHRRSAMSFPPRRT